METIELTLEQSNKLAFLFIIIYLGAAFAVFTLSLSFIYKILGLLLMLFLFYKNWQLYISKKTKQAIIKIWQNSKGQWGFETRQGNKYKATLLKDSYKSQFLIILRFKTAIKTYNILIPNDAVTQKEYKALSCRLSFFV